MQLDIIGLRVLFFSAGLYLLYKGQASIRNKKADVLMVPGFKQTIENVKMTGKSAIINGVLFFVLGIGLIILSVIYS
jgi:hypothetical protein